MSCYTCYKILADLHMRKALGSTLMKVGSLLSKVHITKISIKAVSQMFGFCKTWWNVVTLKL